MRQGGKPNGPSRPALASAGPVKSGSPGRWLVVPQTGDEPEHHGDQDDRYGNLTKEDEETGQHPKDPVSDQNADDTEHRQPDGVPERHGRPTTPAFYVFAHKPDATFPPCPLIRHYVTGGADCSPNQG